MKTLRSVLKSLLIGGSLAGIMLINSGDQNLVIAEEEYFGTSLPKIKSSKPVKMSYSERVEDSFVLNIEPFLQGTELDIKIPREYKNIPPHPDDVHNNEFAKTGKVKLNSGRYTSASIGFDISPFPYPIAENLKFGYIAIFPLVSNEKGGGISATKKYSSGEEAYTYSRIVLPGRVDSLRLSWRQPISESTEISYFFREKDPKTKSSKFFYIEGGLSLDLWRNVKVEGGWDRWSKEEQKLSDSFNSSSVNPFVKFGWEERNIHYSEIGEEPDWEKRQIYLDNLKQFDSEGFRKARKKVYSEDRNESLIYLFVKKENITGKVRYGRVNIKGNTVGIGWGFNF